MSLSTTGSRVLFRGPGSPAERASHLEHPLAQTPEGDPPQGLGRHLTAHLGVAALALDELDRHLDHAQARLEGADGEIGLEDVAGRLDMFESDPLQRRTTEQAVTGGRVADRDAEQGAGVEVAA